MRQVGAGQLWSRASSTPPCPRTCLAPLVLQVCPSSLIVTVRSTHTEPYWLLYALHTRRRSASFPDRRPQITCPRCWRAWCACRNALAVTTPVQWPRWLAVPAPRRAWRSWVGASPASSAPPRCRNSATRCRCLTWARRRQVRGRCRATAAASGVAACCAAASAAFRLRADGHPDPLVSAAWILLQRAPAQPRRGLSSSRPHAAAARRRPPASLARKKTEPWPTTAPPHHHTHTSTHAHKVRIEGSSA